MAMSKRELKEWKNISAKSKRHKIPVKRIGSNIVFLPHKPIGAKENVYTQLGIGKATTIMDARIKVKTQMKKK